MRYKLFGNHTGLRVSELALGTASFGTGWGYGAEREQAQKLFDMYADTGGNFIDCADTYQNGEAETLVGEFVASDRDHFVVATKFTLDADPNGGISRTGNSRKNMVRSVEASLKRLKTDRIDLYWVHMSDGVTPVEEIARGFDDLARAGKIVYAGISDFPAWRVARAATIAELRGWAPIIGLQIEYSLVERSPDRELLPMAEAMGLGTAVWSPLGGGTLSGKYRRGEEGRLSRGGRLVHKEEGGQKTAVVDLLHVIANETGASPAQVAIAWLRHKAAVSSSTIVPILGARTLDQLSDNLKSLSVVLSEDQAQRLEEVSAVPLGFPHQMLNGEPYRSRIPGGKPQLFDWPRTPPA